MPDLPTGTVTFLFTDLEGSTALWERDPDAMRAVLARHDAIAEDAVRAYGGRRIKPRGEGDSLFCVFARATDAVGAALTLQQRLLAEPWPEAAPVRIRAAIHSGEADLWDGDYYGNTVNRCARLRAIGHGGQTLISATTYGLVRDELPTGATVQDLGDHRLRDLSRAERVYQVSHPGLPSEFPSLRSLNALSHNLPQQMTTFIGREEVMTEVRKLVETSRLVTLTGAGGTGKTRLSLQVAAELVDRYPEGIWFVELALLSDPRLVPQSVATAMGVKEEPGKTITDTLAGILRERRTLLVLDNCEHVLDEVARLVETLLRQAPDVSVLATSREALAITGEQTYRVPSLSIPDPTRLPPFEALSQYESVRLFIDRALLVRPSFQVTNDNAPALAQLCYRLDGIPLAIELAAARVRAMSVERITERLDDRFRLLTGGSRTALPRQQTLRALIDWSYDLLDEKEKLLLRRLSVFAGGWTLEAAEAVCSDPPPAAE